MQYHLFVQNMITKSQKIPQKCQYAGYLSIFGGFLVQLTLGAVYTYGNMVPYLLSYMRNHTYPFPSKEINSGNLMWIFGLSVFGWGCSMSLGGFLKIGVMMTILLGSWLMSFGVILTYFTINVHLSLISLSYGLLVGIGVGIAYGTILSVPVAWFPNHKGLVTGVVVSGFGLSPIVFDYIQSYYINKDIMSVELKNSDHVPSSFLVMGTIFATVQLIGSILIKMPKQDILPIPANNIAESTSLIQENETGESFSNRRLFNSIDQELLYNVRPDQIFYERNFWVLWISFTLNTVDAVIILTLHKEFGKLLCIKDRDLIAVSAVGALANSVGRISWGCLIDRLPYRIVMVILTTTMTVMLGTLFLCINLFQTKSTGLFPMYFIWVVILHFLLSGNFSIFPTTCGKTFGMKYSVINYGILFTAYAISGILTSVLTTVMLTDNLLFFKNTFFVGSGLAFLSCLFCLLYRENTFIHIVTN